MYPAIQFLSEKLKIGRTNSCPNYASSRLTVDVLYLRIDTDHVHTHTHVRRGMLLTFHVSMIFLRRGEEEGLPL